MGCCNIKHEEILGGLILPDLQEVIHNIQQSHPFAQLPAFQVFTQINRFQRTKQISKHLFNIILKRLKIPSAPFYNPQDRLFFFSRGITNSTKYFDIFRLLVSAILLGQADLQTKLKLLFQIFSEDQKINRNQFRQMIHGLADVAINILPRMSRTEILFNDYQSYINRLKAQIPEIVSVLMEDLDPQKASWTKQEFIQLFQTQPEMQKICWPHGIRIMAIEQDLRYMREKSKENEKQVLTEGVLTTNLDSPRDFQNFDIPDQIGVVGVGMSKTMSSPFGRFEDQKLSQTSKRMLLHQRETIEESAEIGKPSSLSLQFYTPKRFSEDGTVILRANINNQSFYQDNQQNMGCKTSSKVRTVNRMSWKLDFDQQLNQIAGLPMRAQDDDFDLQNAVQLFIKCKDLPNVDRFSLTDPMVVFYTQNDQDRWIVQGRTQVQKNNLNPEFITTFKIAYSFQKQRKFKFQVYDINHFEQFQSLSRQKFLGFALVNIHEIVCSPQKSVTKPIMNKKKNYNNGSITVISQQLSYMNHKVKMIWALDSQRIKGHLYLNFYRSGDNQLLHIFQTEAKPKRPVVWNPFQLSLNRLCKGEMDRDLKVRLTRLQQKKADVVLGQTTFSMNSLIKEQSKFLPLYLKQGFVCNLTVKQCELVEKPLFLEYILGGCQVSLIIGIDFTKSNKFPTDSDSLHYFDEENPNEYVQAIRAVGDILQYYDTDKKIPVFGFGAKLPPFYNIVSNCFALNNNIFDPEVKGISGVIQAYKKTLGKVTFHGPTIFSQLIETACNYAQNVQISQERQQYFILLVLTDGDISDIEKTIDALVRASDLPISIIIVGVGTEDFTSMKYLDADQVPLFSNKLNRQISRDIVQFVPFIDYKGYAQLLAKQVLFEVPQQLVSFMTSIHIYPNAAEQPIRQNSVTGLKVPNKTLPSITRIHPSSLLLMSRKKEFINKIARLGFDRNEVTDIVQQGVPCTDVNLVLELLYRNAQKQPVVKPSVQKPVTKKKKQKIFQHVRQRCFRCGKRVDVRFGICGHEVVCQECVNQIGMQCPACGVKIIDFEIKIINYN